MNADLRHLSVERPLASGQSLSHVLFCHVELGSTPTGQVTGLRQGSFQEESSFIGAGWSRLAFSSLLLIPMYARFL